MTLKPIDRVSQADRVKEAHIKRENDRKETMFQLFKGEGGVSFFKWMKEAAGFGKLNVVINKEDINTDAMVFNEGRKSMYLEMRSYIPREALIKIEMPEKEEA